MPAVRLQKLIAEAGICSRRKAETLIQEGLVRVNRKVVRELGSKADPEKDKIEVDGVLLQAEKKVYYLINKPDGLITSNKDEEGRPTVFTLVDETRRLVSVGRLDYHTEGVLILTNDGTLVHALTHPANEISREYEVKVKGKLAPQQLKQIESGVLLDDGPANPVIVEKMHSTEKNSWYVFILTEGRNREVRRIVEAVGSTVLKLRRTAFANLRVDELAVGDSRRLTPVEVLDLYETAGLWRDGKGKAPSFSKTPRKTKAQKEAALRKRQAANRAARLERKQNRHNDEPVGKRSPRKPKSAAEDASRSTRGKSGKEQPKKSRKSASGNSDGNRTQRSEKTRSSQADRKSPRRRSKTTRK